MALTRCAALDVAAARHPRQRGRRRAWRCTRSWRRSPATSCSPSSSARGVRPRRRAVGGRQRDGLPGQRLLVVPDRRGRLREQPACHEPASRQRRPPRRAARDRGAAVRRARSTRTRRCATSPTPRASCRAASITTSTPRSRWSTRSCAPSSTTLFEQLRRDRRARLAAAAKLEAVVAPPSRRSTSTTPRSRSSRTTPTTWPTSRALRLHRRAQPASSAALWTGLLDDGVAAGELPRRPRRRAGLPLPARHRLGRGPLVPPGRRARPPTRSPHQYLSILLDGIAAARRPTDEREEGDTMAEAYIVDAVRTPVGKRGGSLSRGALRRPRRPRLTALVERNRRRPGRRRRRDLRLRRHDRPAGRRHRPHRLAVRRAARPRARRDRSTGSAARRSRPCTSPPRRSCAAPRPRRRRRRAEHERDPDLGGDDRRPAVRLHARRSPGRPGWASATATRRSRSSASAEMIAEKWDISREDMERFALAEPPARAGRDRRGPVRPRDRPVRRAFDDRRGPARRHVLEKMAALETLREGGRITAAVASQISDARRACSSPPSTP